MRRPRIVVVLCLACSGEPSSTTTVVAAGPTPFTGVEAFSNAGSGLQLSTAGARDASWVTIAVASEAGACDRVVARTVAPGSSALQLHVVRLSPDPVGAGTYALGGAPPEDGTPVASASLVAVDDSCALAAPPRAGTAGTVTFTQVLPDRVRGRLDVKLDDGTRISGPFDAPGCAAASGVGYADTFTCGP